MCTMLNKFLILSSIAILNFSFEPQFPCLRGRIKFLSFCKSWLYIVFLNWTFTVATLPVVVEPCGG